MLPIIISGGKGTRLWPYSRANFPKPFCDFFDENLMQMTIKRVSALGQPGVVSVEDQKVLTQIAFKNTDIKPSFSVFEPFGRNTAASVAVACHLLNQQKRDQEVVGIFWADQLIQNTDLFLKTMKLAEERARSGRMVTIGVPPTFPSTGFGYIETSEKQKSGIQSVMAKRFHEKPTESVAKNYIESGRYFWNAGIFVFRVDMMVDLFKTHAGDLWNKIQNIKVDLSNIGEVYKTLTPISIDYAIMEKLSDNFECIPCEMGWSDVGTWSEIKKYAKPHGTTFQHLAKGNTAFSMDSKKTVAFVGVDDLIVVDTGDALLITKDEGAPKVGNLVSEIEKVNADVVQEHLFDHRPWGDYQVLEDAEHYKVKSIRVKAGEQISYQSHGKRAEHWIVVRGEAIVTLNDKDIPLKPGDHIFIPVGAKHRIRNDTTKTVEFVEVQTGDYFGEDDIVRYSDIYGRA